MRCTATVRRQYSKPGLCQITRGVKEGLCQAHRRVAARHARIRPQSSGSRGSLFLQSPQDHGEHRESDGRA